MDHSKKNITYVLNCAVFNTYILSTEIFFKQEAGVPLAALPPTAAPDREHECAGCGEAFGERQELLFHSAFCGGGK